MSDWYFSKFEHRKPPAPVPASALRDGVYQTLAIMAIVLGLRYLIWRWTLSLNHEAMWFAVPLVLAESLAFIGSVLFFLSVWRTKDTEQKPPPAMLSDIVPLNGNPDRPLAVDVFFPTYNEDLELVRLSIRDAKAMTYPHPIDLRIHVLDDGRREAMKLVCDEEGVGYLTRSSNIGYKAGNMRNGMEHTHGDLLVICDADTRPFTQFLEKTLGYFRDPQVAWVQTPQWFFDLDEGVALPEYLARRWHLGGFGRALGKGVQAVIGSVQVGADLLGNDPQLFYDVIQRRRNWCNGSFCCGAGSVHRRDAVMEVALKGFSDKVQADVEKFSSGVADALSQDLRVALTEQAIQAVEFTPYKFHVSEDIYTSIALHSDTERKWSSVFHPEPLTKMLSPQDLLTWCTQRFKYAGGTLDIFWNDNPITRRLTPWQRLTYGATIYSYFAPLWIVVFLVAPIIYFFLGVSPVAAYDTDFYSHFVPFILVNKLAFIAATWGVQSWRGEQYYIAFFWLNLKALRDVLLGKPIKFHVTPKTKQAGNFAGLVMPQIALILASALGALFMGCRLALGQGVNPGSYWANVFWTLNNIMCLSVIVRAAFYRSPEETPS